MRNYNPSIGRFISRDSFAGSLNDPLSLNLYTYCVNNPIYYSDPTGHIAVVDDIIIAGIFAAATVVYALSQPEVQEGLSECVSGAKYLAKCIARKTVSGICTVADFLDIGTESYLSPPKSEIHKKFSTVGTDLAFDESWQFTQDLIGRKKIAKFILTSQISSILTRHVDDKYKNRETQNVYLLYDPDNSQIEYVGRTNNLVTREQFHENSANRGHLTMIPIAENIPYEAARGLEQMGIEYYNTYNPVKYGGNAYNNQINGISPVNPLRLFFYADAIPYAINLYTVKKENNLKIRK